jgi:hypothetical protein
MEHPYIHFATVSMLRKKMAISMTYFLTAVTQTITEHKPQYYTHFKILLTLCAIYGYTHNTISVLISRRS